MRKKKRENHMLINCANFLINMLTSYQSRVFFSITLILSLSACSVTQDSNLSGDQKLSSSGNKVYLEAISEMKSGSLKRAQILLAKVIKQQPNFSNAHVNLSIIYINMKMLKKAETSLQQALKIDPNNIYALNQQGYLHRANGEFSKAKDSYARAIDIDSDYANAHLNLGILYDLYLYDLENAIEQYKKYSELSKDKDKKVSKWIVELERRNKKSLSER